MKREIISLSPEETFKTAAELGASASPGDIITLSGELGTGKTLFARGIASGMGLDDDITSPSFSIMEMHEGPVPLYHFDLYRIENPAELDELFFDEYWEGDGVSVIEWPEMAGGRLPARLTRVTIDYTGSHTRRITIEYPDD